MLDFCVVLACMTCGLLCVYVCGYTPQKVIHVTVFNGTQGCAYSHRLHLKLNLQNTEMTYCIHLSYLTLKKLLKINDGIAWIKKTPQGQDAGNMQLVRPKKS